MKDGPAPSPPPTSGVDRGAGAALAPTSLPRRRVVLGAVWLVALVLGAYLPAFHAGFVWDDDDYVTENPVLRLPGGLRAIWTEPRALPQYYPLVHTTYWVEYRLWGLDPRGYHAVNVALHAASAVLLWALLRRLGLAGAWLAAAVFALHPVGVESVAWITERKNTLSLLLYLLAALAFLPLLGLTVRDASSPEAAASSRGRWWTRYALGCAAFAGALLSKTVTCSLPAALLVLTWWRRGRLTRREVLPTLPLFAAGLTAGLFTAWLEHDHVGARTEAFDLSPAQRVLVAGRALWFYAGKLVWPEPLAFVYPRWEVDPAAAWQWLYPVAALLLLGALWALRRRLGRGPLATALLFAGTLFPALGFVDVYPFKFSFVADHFQYHASLFPLAATTAAFAALFQRQAPRVRRLGVGAAALLLVCLGALAFTHASVFRHEEALYRDTLETNPESYLAHGNLGALLLERSLRLDQERDARALAARAEAVTHLRRALALAPDRLERALVTKNLGTAAAAEGRAAEALALYREAVRLRPDGREERLVLAKALHDAGRTAEAVGEYRRALDLAPRDHVALNNLARLLLEAEDPALRDLDEARRLALLGCGWRRAAGRGHGGGRPGPGPPRRGALGGVRRRGRRAGPRALPRGCRRPTRAGQRGRGSLIGAAEPPSPRPRAAAALRALPAAVVVALFVVGVGGSAILTTYRLAARAAVRGPNTLGEEGKLYFARHVQRGEAPFAPGTEPPFYPSFHGALVHASVGFVAWIGDLGPDGIYWTGRLISILATLALLAVFGALLRGLDVPTPLLVAALAAWLAHEELVQHAVSFRPDHWNLCLSALACGLLARGRGRPWETLLLALIPVVAFFVKAPGALLALPIAACLLLQGRRRAALGCSLGSAVIASAAMWILDATSAGRFSAGLIGGVAMPTSPWLAWLLLRDVRLWIPLLLPLFLIPWALAPDPGRRARQALLVFWSFSLPLSLLTSMRFGSNTYYFLEPYTYGLLLATAWLARELAAREGRRPGRAPALQCLVALTSLLHLSGLVGTWTAWPTDWSMAYTAKVGRDRAAVAARLNERRLSCFSDDSALNVLLDRPAVIYPTFLSLRVLAGEREAEPVLEPFERQRYDVVLLTGIERSARGVPVLAPELREAIEASYVRLDSALTYEVYVPRGLARRQVPGWLLEPEHLGGSAPTGGR